ncbi:DUF5916 domain-containing protein [Thalassotalea ganghwensis]
MKNIHNLAFLMALTANTAVADIVLDGQLNEQEWQTAQVFDQFVQTSPDTGAKPSVATQVKFITDDNGLYFAFVNQQDKQNRSRKYSGKDQHTSADFNSIAIDFSGQGDTIYDFVVTLGGGSMDGVYTRGNQYDDDWEGAWDFSVSEDEENWYAEVFIPWAIAPYSSAEGNDADQVKLFFSRYHIANGEQYAFPDTSPSKANFMQALRPVLTDKPTGGTFDWFPYASFARDINQGENTHRVGVDVIWKPTQDQQLTVAINPDFGQAESDELVANFSAVETLYSDRRAFFTENQSLFDVKDEGIELLNTRRIGASPDGADQLNRQPSDILLAAKYLSTNQLADFGVMAVKEEDQGLDQGKHFVSGRWLVKGDSGYLGQIINWVERPVLDRQALTSAVDFGYWFDNITLDGKLLSSNSKELTTEKGYGGVVNTRIIHSRFWDSKFSLTWLDDSLNLNDMGYLARNDLKQLSINSQMLILPDDEGSAIRDYEVIVDGKLAQNGAGENLVDQYALELVATTQASSSWTGRVAVKTSGIDDLITRGHGSLMMPSQYDFGLIYNSPYAGKLHYQLEFHRLEEGVSGWGNSYQLALDYSISDQLQLATSYYQLRSDDWLIGNSDGQLTRYQREFAQYSINVLWLLADNQELSLKSQWFGVNAFNGKVYQQGDNFERTAADQLGFKQSQLAMQLRYRYRFAPLSDVYLVYVRNGGFYQTQTEDQQWSNHDIFNQQFNHPDDHQLFAKVRMRF